MEFSATYLLAIIEVAWINILLSGDNAVVIALACRSLPPNQKRIGVFLGSAAAIVLRIIFAFMITRLMGVPYLQAVGGALLIWIAVSLTRGNGDNHNVKAHDRLWRAVATVALADAAMSLDNVIAIAAVARGDHWLFIIGLALSIPLIVVGATMIGNLLARFPILVWAGSALLAWIAGEMIGDDRALLAALGLSHGPIVHYGSAALGVAIVVLLSLAMKARAKAAGQAVQ